MKKVIGGLAMAVLLFACSNNNSQGPIAGNDLSNDPVYNKGLDVLVKYDCLTCHKVEDKIQGPSYREIANKYAGQPDAVKYLSEKIIKGGSGVWGKEAMAAHPNMPQQDAEDIVHYILLLKK